jgi:hypothetical protein
MREAIARMTRPSITLLLALVAVTSACLDPGPPCGNGHCPDGTVCASPRDRCVYPEQTETCHGVADGATCPIPDRSAGVCVSGVCLAPACGDGIAEGTEECDGADARGVANCHAWDPRFHEPRPLVCRDDCTIDRPSCGPFCGDRVVDATHEECDGAPKERSCIDEGFHSGTLMCSSQCRLDLSTCAGRCGDGVRTAGELCDGDDHGARSCSSEGFYAGRLACRPTCDAVDVSGCTDFCGDGVRNGDEACDGPDFGALSCDSYGWNSGSLRCGVDCRSIDTSTCSGYCGDGVRNGDERCDGLDVEADACTGRGALAGAVVCTADCQPSAAQCFWGRARVVETGLSGAPTAGWSFSSHDVWVADEHGAVAHFDGTVWHRVEMSGYVVATLWGTPDGQLWARDGDGALLRYDGTRWVAVVDLATSTLAWGLSGGVVWTAKVDGATTVVRRIEGAASTLYTVDTQARKIWSSSPDGIWIAGSSDVRHFDGHSWSTHIPNDGGYVDLWGSGPNDVWALGLRSVQHHDGQRWTRTGLSGGHHTMQAWSRGPGAFSAVRRGSLSAALITGDHGVTRHVMPLPITVGPVWGSQDETWMSLTGRLYRLDAFPWFGTPEWSQMTIDGVHLDGQTTWLSGSGGVRSLKWSDGGSSQEYEWETRSTRPATSVFASGLQAWSAEESGLWELRDGQWSQLDVLTDASAIRFLGRGADDLWAFGPSGTFRYDGADWRERPNEDGTALGQLTAIGNETWALSDDQMTIYGHDGTTWRQLFTRSAAVAAMYGSGPDDVWLFATDGTVSHHDGRTWMDTTPAKPVSYSAAWGNGPRDVWAVTAAGDVEHFDGVRWSPLRVPGEAPVAHIAGSGNNVVLAARESSVFQLTHPLPTTYGGACERPLVIGCNTSLRGHTRGAADGPADCGADEHGGGEVVYRLDNPVTGTMTARVRSWVGDLDLVVLGADERLGCDPAACLAVGEPVGAATEVTMDVSHGDLLYLAVGATDEPAPYTIEIACTKR